MITSTTFSLFAELGDARHKGKGDAKPRQLASSMRNLSGTT
jgi:hypothetical protein